MRIVYHIDCLRTPMTGVAYYTLNMLTSMMHYFPDLDIIAYRHHQILSKQDIQDLFETLSLKPTENTGWKTSLIEIINQSSTARHLIQWKENLHHQIKLKHRLKNSLYHEPNFALLPHQGPKVLTVHDMSMFTCPEFLPSGRAQFLQTEMKKSLEQSDALIVSCEYTQKEITRFSPKLAKKIHVIAPGAKEQFKPRSEAETNNVLEKFQLRYQGFLLCVATLEPRKNLKRLIHAYQQIPRDLQEHFPLILVGNKGWMYEELLSLIETSKTSTIKLLPYVEEQDLYELYAAAYAFIYPSLYEGFGLPVLEAMQSGLPVITSNVSSLPDVCKEAGFLINPLDEKEISKTIEMLLSTDTQTYKTYVEQSLRRAKTFSWENFARNLCDVYQKL